MKNIAGEGSSSNITKFFVQPGPQGDKVHVAEGNLVFHCVKHHNNYRSTDWTSNLMKKVFSD